jgi:LysR family transcriptional regulator, transcriptional activator of the cysJI operon
VSVEALAGEDFIAFERDIPTRKTVDRVLKRHKVVVNYVMEFDNVETIKRSVEVGVGVLILPEITVANEVRNKQLVALNFTEGVFTRSVAVIRRKGKVFSAAARAFVDMLTSA